MHEQWIPDAPLQLFSSAWEQGYDEQTYNTNIKAYDTGQI